MAAPWKGVIDFSERRKEAIVFLVLRMAGWRFVSRKLWDEFGSVNPKKSLVPDPEFSPRTEQACTEQYGGVELRDTARPGTLEFLQTGL
jgi:hypothetical protein